MSHRWSLLFFLCLLSKSAGAQTVPFQAWLDADSVYARAQPNESAPIVGLLNKGDLVTVTRCDPDCNASDGWGVLNDDGAVPLRHFQCSPEDEDHAALNASAQYFYGTVRGDGTPLYRQPHAGRIQERMKAARVVAFRQNQPFADQGWLESSEGGFVRTEGIRLAKPSTFEGVHDPGEVEVFTVRKTWLRLRPGVFGPPMPVPKHASFRAIEVTPEIVWTSSGFLRRDDVRLAVARARPQGIPASAAWAYVDLTEQALTVYEGDHPVFSTLVSTGKQGHRTPKGIFQVWLKAVHHRMTGRHAEQYQVDEVPYAMFINKGVALHGAFWHDAFGRTYSHGCINLSLADAKWLFDWAPPRLPEGWRSAIPWPARRESLWVTVQAPPAIHRWRGKPEPVASPPFSELLDDANGESLARPVTLAALMQDRFAGPECL